MATCVRHYQYRHPVAALSARSLQVPCRQPVGSLCHGSFSFMQDVGNKPLAPLFLNAKLGVGRIVVEPPPVFVVSQAIRLLQHALQVAEFLVPLVGGAYPLLSDPDMFLPPLEACWQCAVESRARGNDDAYMATFLKAITVVFLRVANLRYFSFCLQHRVTIQPEAAPDLTLCLVPMTSRCGYRWLPILPPTPLAVHANLAEPFHSSMPLS